MMRLYGFNGTWSCVPTDNTNEIAYPRLYTYVANKCEMGNDVMTTTRALTLKLERYKCKGLKSNRVFLWDTCDPFILVVVRFQVRRLM